MKNNNRKAAIKSGVSRRKVVHHVICMSPAQYNLRLPVIHEYIYINMYLYVNKEAKERDTECQHVKCIFIRYLFFSIIKIVDCLLMLL